MIKNILLILILLLPLSANADWSIAGGADVVHIEGDLYGEIRYTGEHWSVYAGTDQTFGGDFFMTFYQRLLIGAGIETAQYDPEIISTNWAYQFRVEFKITKQWNVMFKHTSNCRSTCDNAILDWAPRGDLDSENDGFNYFGLRYKF